MASKALQPPSIVRKIQSVLRPDSSSRVTPIDSRIIASVTGIGRSGDDRDRQSVKCASFNWAPEEMAWKPTKELPGNFTADKNIPRINAARRMALDLDAGLIHG